MNENIDLTKILKDCPIDWKLYSSIWGEVRFKNILESKSPIVVELSDASHQSFMANGKFLNYPNSECCLFPSKEQRDWSKFKAPWYKKDKFDPKTLKAFDRVLVRHEYYHRWRCEFYSYIHDDNGSYPYVTIGGAYKRCIPYNEETKHLVGTKEEAPEYYRYWED